MFESIYRIPGLTEYPVELGFAGLELGELARQLRRAFHRVVLESDMGHREIERR